MAKSQTFNSFQALELILQPGSDDELEVDHYESRNKSVEDEDFGEDVPQIDGSPEYETDDVYVDRLTWSPVDERRRRARLITFFKFHHGEVVIMINITRKPAPSPPTRTTRSTHAEAFLLPAYRTPYRQKSFFPLIIVEWNALPSVGDQSATVEAFRNQI